MVRRSDVDGRADIYSIAVMLFQMLTGQLPIVADHAMAAIMAVATRVPKRLRALDASLDADLDALIAKCLAKDPAHRIQSAEAFRERLIGMLADPPTQRMRKDVQRSSGSDALEAPTERMRPELLAEMARLDSVIDAAAQANNSFELRWRHVGATAGFLCFVVLALYAFV